MSGGTDGRAGEDNNGGVIKGAAGGVDGGAHAEVYKGDDGRIEEVADERIDDGGTDGGAYSVQTL